MSTPAAEQAVAAAQSFGSAALALNYFEQVVERSCDRLTQEDRDYKEALRCLAKAERETMAANDAAPMLGEAA